jgi:prefoldin alpha subunit
LPERHRADRHCGINAGISGRGTSKNIKRGKMAEKDMKRELEEKYMEFQVLEQQLKNLQGNLQNIESQIIEIKSMQQAVSGLESIKPGSDILVPVANGMFARGTLKDSGSILVNVGGNIVVDKTLQEAIQLLGRQAEEISGIRQQFLAELSKVESKMHSIEAQLQKLVSGNG